MRLKFSLTHHNTLTYDSEFYWNSVIPRPIKSMDDLLNQRLLRCDRLQYNEWPKLWSHEQLHISGTHLLHGNTDLSHFVLIKKSNRMLQIHCGDVRLYFGKTWPPCGVPCVHTEWGPWRPRVANVTAGQHVWAVHHVEVSHISTVLRNLLDVTAD